MGRETEEELAYIITQSGVKLRCAKVAEISATEMRSNFGVCIIYIVVVFCPCRHCLQKHHYWTYIILHTSQVGFKKSL